MPKRTAPTPTPPPEQLTLWSRLRVQLSPARQREIVGLLLALAGILTLISLLGLTGALTAFWANLLRQFAGWGAYVIGIALIIAGLILLRREENVFDEFPIAWDRLVAFEVLFAVSMGLVHLALASDDHMGAQMAEAGEGGGYLGYAIEKIIVLYLGPILGAILLIAIGLLTLRFLLDLSRIGAVAMQALEKIRPMPARAAASPARPTPALRTPVRPAPPALNAPDEEPDLSPAPARAAAKGLPATIPTNGNDKVPDPAQRPKSVGSFLSGMGRKPATPPPPPPLTYDPMLAVPRAKMLERTDKHPELELLDESAEAQYAQSTAEQKARTIKETLEQFGIPADVIDTQAGPTITRFAVRPGFFTRKGPDGEVIYQRKVPVNRILALSNDLALALAASPIRIEAPVPGRDFVGIEVPNEQISVVSLRRVMDSPAYKKIGEKKPLPFALGRDVSGEPAVADLGSMPHLLIAGATGSGKSVCINAVIACMLFKHSPDTLRMIMVDPKRVELVNYNGIPHLLGPVITDVDQVVPALRWVAGLMDARFKAFSKAQTRNVEAYNAKMDKTGGDRLPYVVIIIDELADLMLASPEETEKLITRLAQMARATGIHLILATQRPSVDVVTGLIKANFPARISFSVTSSVDSRVVLDTPGAEKLLGRGDMLYMAPDSAKLARLQGCFVSDDELARLSNYWRGLQEQFDYIKAAPWEGQKLEADEEETNSGDELTNKAIEIIRTTNKASISSLQTKLGIGYPRAARLMDQLEGMGLVGPDEGNGKPRAIYLPEEDKKKKKK
ncbi:MAG: DNA translocase FtsK 4TM domain-containing protein [Anaerolineae bacterium]